MKYKLKFKHNLMISLIIALSITASIYIFIDKEFPIIFGLAIFHLVLILIEKIILPIMNINKSKIKEYKYFREEVDCCSPMINAFLLNKNMFNADVISAMILYLESKGYDGSKDYKNDNLLPHEMNFIQKKDFYISYLKNKDYNNKDLKQFEKLVISDMENLNIIEDDNRNWFVDNSDWVTIISILLQIELAVKIPSNYIILPIIYYTFMILVYFLYYILNLSIIKVLTEEGKEYLSVLLASKRFLKSFSVISSRNIEEKELWDSYLYNAILFNLKGKLDKDAKEHYRSILSKNDYYINKKDDLVPLIIGFTFVLWPWVYLYIKGPLQFKLLLGCLLVNPLIIAKFVGLSMYYKYKNIKYMQ